MRRRAFLGTAAMMAGTLAMPARAQDAPVTFVLIHGAWHGAWCWQLLTPLLEARGHEVIAPTLAGMGERAGELSADITLDTHIDEVVDLLDRRRVQNAVLVGHSYAGVVISGVADRVPHRLRRLVFLDAVIVENGQSLGGTRQSGRAAALPPMPASAFGVIDASERAWVESNLTPHPANTFATPLRLANPLGNGLRCIYVACTRPAMASVGRYLQMARSRLGWQVEELATGHDAMVTAPSPLANLLVRVAA
ncbi:MAG: alpha/beta fold hydrolase [Alphaproteobacteria bacterium]|nr:alpha/beta fold hydrolase [Alphaproteobacteria bacterium]MCW5741674.1 alpha/beta fold hydrolase [Alphaproteobacteria bacterium]